MDDDAELKVKDVEEEALIVRMILHYTVYYCFVRRLKTVHALKEL